MVQTQCASLHYLCGQDYRGCSDVPWGANVQAAKLHQPWPRRQHAYATEEAYEMEFMKDNYIQDYAETEDACYEDTMDQDYDTA